MRCKCGANAFKQLLLSVSQRSTKNLLNGKKTFKKAD
jgi:hypothetical protein